MKFRDELEKILYWIYRSPLTYEGNLRTKDTDVSHLLRDMYEAHHFVTRKAAKESQEAWKMIIRDPDNYLRYFQELDLVSCDLNKGLKNVRLKDLTPTQAVKAMRRKNT